MDFSTLDGRDAIIAAVILVALYLLVSLLRLGTIKFRQSRASHSRKPAGKVEDPREEIRFNQNPVRPVVEEIAQRGAEAAPEYVPPGQRQPSTQFNEQLFRSSVEAELQQLREEVAALKDALAQLKATRSVSPQYNEAMLLAQRGMSAQGIADHCTISIGEAELVVALNRNKLEHENHDKSYDGR